MLGKNNFGPKNSGYKKILVQKNVGTKKILVTKLRGPTKIWIQNKCCVQNNFKPKEIGETNILG